MAGTLVIDTLKSSTTSPPVFQNTSGTEIGQLARAWASFNGTTGTRNASFNVSSVTRNAVGDYTVNFTNAMPNANYACAMMGVAYSTGNITTTVCAYYPSGTGTYAPATKTTTACRVGTGSGSTGSYIDIAEINFMAIGG